MREQPEQKQLQVPKQQVQKPQREQQEPKQRRERKRRRERKQQEQLLPSYRKRPGRERQSWMPAEWTFSLLSSKRQSKKWAGGTKIFYRPDRT
jgi:hypothetical protein